MKTIPTPAELRTQFQDVVVSDSDRYRAPAELAIAGLEGLRELAFYEGVPSASTEALILGVFMASNFPEEAKLSDGDWEALGYDGPTAYREEQEEKLSCTRTLIGDDVLDLMVPIAEAFVAAVKAAPILPSDHPALNVE